jgi:hypothetical protein
MTEYDGHHDNYKGGEEAAVLDAIRLIKRTDCSYDIYQTRIISHTSLHLQILDYQKHNINVFQ